MHRHLSLLFLGTLATQFTAFLASNPVLRGMVGQLLVTLFTLGLAYARKRFDVPVTITTLAAKPDPYADDTARLTTTPPAPAAPRVPPLPLLLALGALLGLAGCAGTVRPSFGTPVTWSSAQWGVCVGEEIVSGPRAYSLHGCTRAVPVVSAAP